MKKKHDPRGSHWPPIFEDKDGYSISAKFLTPGIFCLVESAILRPLIDVWKTILGLLVVDTFLSWINYWSLFSYNDTSRAFVYAMMAFLWVFWQFNIISQYRMIRAIFGKRLRICMTHDGELWIGNHNQSLNHRVAFGVKVVEDAEDEVYKRSKHVSLVIGDQKEKRLATIFGKNDADKFVRNANLMISLGVGPRGGELDVDPMGRR